METLTEYFEAQIKAQQALVKNLKEVAKLSKKSAKEQEKAKTKEEKEKEKAQKTELAALEKQIKQVADVTANVKKRKGGAAESAPKKKRLGSGYNIFIKKNTPRVRSEHPSMTQGEVMKVLGTEWSKLGDEGKAPYNKEAQDAKDAQDASSTSTTATTSITSIIKKVGDKPKQSPQKTVEFTPSYQPREYREGESDDESDGPATVVKKTPSYDGGITASEKKKKKKDKKEKKEKKRRLSQDFNDAED